MHKRAYNFSVASLALVTPLACTSVKDPVKADGRGKQQSLVRLPSQLQQKPLVLKGHQHDVLFVCFSADGKIVMSGDEAGNSLLWNAETGQLLKRLPPLQSTGVQGTFSPNGKMLIYGNTALKVWDVDKAKVSRVLDGHKAIATSNTLVWDEQTSSMKRKMSRNRATVTSMAFSADSKWLATGSDDSTIEIWDVSTGKLRQVLRGHTGAIGALDFSSDGKMLSSGAYNSTVILWAVKTGQLLRKIPVTLPMGESGAVSALCFSKKDSSLATITQSGYILSLDVGTGHQTTFGHQGATTSFAISGDRTRFALGTWDRFAPNLLLGVVKVGSIQTGKISFKLQKRDLMMSWVALSPDGKRLATAGTVGSNWVQVWNIP